MTRTLLLLALPLVLVVGGLLPRAGRWLPRLAAVLMALQVPVSLWVCAPSLRLSNSPLLRSAPDGVSAVFLILTTVIAAAALFQGALLFPAQRGGEHAVTDRRLGLFYTLAGLFLLSMYAVLLARNLGFLWIAMEMTTLMSAPLVYLHRSRHSLEAAWKYLVLCSVGIAFALFGTVLIFAASQPPGGGGTLSLDELLARGATTHFVGTRAPGLDPRLLRLGFIFCLLGYGTKAGLFPLHNWLPDAHSEAPSPASAMLSGALLNCALVGIWRVTQVAAAAGLGSMARGLLVPAGALTVAAASLMLVRQHDLKRMWAYSSVEHVGLLTLAVGIGSGPLFLFHAVNHSLVKAALFLLAGNILHLYGTKELGKLGGLLRAAPAWAILLGAAGFAVAGSPPFGTFVGEWLLLSRLLAAGQAWAAAVTLGGLTVTFVAVSYHLGRVLFGQPPPAVAKTALLSWSLAPAVLISLSLLAGLMLGRPLLDALAAWTLSGGAR